MDEIGNQAVRQYERKWNHYNAFTLKLRDLITELLQANGLDVEDIEFRTKEVESFSRKIKNEAKSYQNPLEEVTDLCGLRIVTYYIEDVDRAEAILRGEFTIDEDNSVDKAEILDPDRFGYLSVHYVLSINAERASLTEWKAFSDLKAEIQVRTVLQHAWSAIDHKLRYKATEEVPSGLKRQLFRLSALFELADQQFSELREISAATNEEYVTDVQRGQLEIEVNLDSVESYFRSSDLLDKWSKEALKVGFRNPHEPHDIDALRRLFQAIQMSGITRIAQLDRFLRGAEKWGPAALAKVKDHSAKRGFAPFAVGYDVVAILLLLTKAQTIPASAIEELNFRDQLAKAIMSAVVNIEQEVSHH
jgi:putative GTP pyrophosphokinase